MSALESAVGVCYRSAEHAALSLIDMRQSHSVSAEHRCLRRGPAGLSIYNVSSPAGGDLAPDTTQQVTRRKVAAFACAAGAHSVSRLASTPLTMLSRVPCWSPLLSRAAKRHCRFHWGHLLCVSALVCPTPLTMLSRVLALLPTPFREARRLAWLVSTLVLLTDRADVVKQIG